jgi:V/A-type H+-transporting ATPase subunit I
MFFPQEMTEIELVVPSKDILAVTKMLSGHAIFHQADSSYINSLVSASSVNSWQEQASAYSALERKIQVVMQAISIDEGHSPTTALKDLVDLDTVRSDLDEIDHEVKQIIDKIASSQKRIEQYQGIIHQLEPVADIHLDLNSLTQSRFLSTILGVIPAANIDRLQTSLERYPFVLLTLRQEGKNAVVWLAGTKNNADVLDRAARSAYVNPFSLPEGYTGTPTEIIQSMRTNIDGIQKEIEAQKKILIQISVKRRVKLQSLLWDIRASRLLADAIARFGHLRYSYIITGWIPSDEMGAFKKYLKQTSKEALLEAFPIQRAEAPSNVPVRLKNPKAFRPFQMLITIYGRPSYSEVDPTPMMAVIFPLLFGAMFGDLGHGLVLLLLGGLLASRKVKSLSGMASLGSVIAVCGAVAAVFGVLYGSVFGFEDLIHPLWFHPVQNIMQILIITIGAGLVLLSFGFLLGIYNESRRHDWSGMLFNHNGVAGLVLYWSLLGLAGSVALKGFPIPTYIFAVTGAIGLIGVMFSEVFKNLMEGHHPLIEGSFGIYFTQAFFELFEVVISFLSNSLSFVRVGAFAVAHGSLSSVFFILGEMVSPGKGIGYWIMLLIGNIFIIGFEGLIVGIQTMRLSYYEFFGKFFRGGGTRFEPLSVRPVENQSS